MEHFRQCLNKLAATPPRRKAALIRSLLPGIETALRCGHGLKEIWVALEGEGLQMSYRVFHKTVSRSRNAKKDRKSTRLNSSHGYISYAVFCLKKKRG